MIESTLLEQRRAGLLLHPTSLPGPYQGGDIGPEAFRFVDFLADSGCSVWQMLPLGPTHEDGSPYQCLSVNAGNPSLISLDWLVDRGWLDLSQLHMPVDSPGFREHCLKLAGQNFATRNDEAWNGKLQIFSQKQQSWLNDFSLFMVLKSIHKDASWNEWPKALTHRKKQALKEARIKHAEQIAQIEFEQFVFFTQWGELREYAHNNGVKLFGDMPIFVSFDSSDVWACRENFLMDKDGQCEFVAGVPPDAFSDTGQRWGNPLYDWDYLQSTQFDWWVQRFATQLELFDIIRVDHFRGFEASWFIPAEEETAIIGEWVKTPGKELLQVLNENFNSLPLVAEDLGVITDEVVELRTRFSLPGMKILQFAFDGDSRNLYLPHHHEQRCVVYTGTHDNDTTLGWYLALDENSKRFLHDYLGVDEDAFLDMPWVLNRMALASVANLAILPMQDILNLDSSHRMNEPSTTEGNWSWKFEWDQLWPGLSSDLRKLVKLYNR